MPVKPQKDENSRTAFENLRKKIANGGLLLVEKLTDDELLAMHKLLLEGKAEIISSACRPYLAAKLDRTIISH